MPDLPPTVSYDAEPMETGPGISTFAGETRKPEVAYRLARWSLGAFLTTFIISRILVFLIMTRRIHDFYLHVGGNHVHHLNYGIFLLSLVGGYLVFFRPRGHRLSAAAAMYGIGLALTFDEFGMWLHMGGSYWQRDSFDAVVVIAAVLGLICVAPAIQRFKPRHWIVSALLSVLVLVFGYVLIKSINQFGEKKIAPVLYQIEQSAPS
jgi:hypothetical protein